MNCDGFKARPPASRLRSAPTEGSISDYDFAPRGNKQADSWEVIRYGPWEKSLGSWPLGLALGVGWMSLDQPLFGGGEGYAISCTCFEDPIGYAAPKTSDSGDIPYDDAVGPTTIIKQRHKPLLNIATVHSMGAIFDF